MGVIVTLLGGVLGALMLLFGLMGASGAPQEASAAALAVAFVAIPYCMTAVVQRREILDQQRLQTASLELLARESSRDGAAAGQV